MALLNLTINVHVPGSGSGDIAADIQNFKQMATEQFEQLKTQLQAQDAKLTVVNENVTAAHLSLTGVAEDIAGLKAKIDELSNGASAEQIAELRTIASSLNEKTTFAATALGDLNTKLADLDAATPAPEPVPAPEA